jgi:UPF0755 protein
MAKIWRILFLSLLLVLLAVSGPVLYFKNYMGNPTNMGNKPFRIRIERGMSVADVAETLRSQRVIKNASNFTLLCRMLGATIPAGEYRIHPRLKPRELISAFEPKNLAFHRLTIPEGSTLRDIAAIVENSLEIDASAFLKNCTDDPFIESLGIQADNLEGYLFPETYHFEPRTSAPNVIERMVKEFFGVIEFQQRERISELGTTLHKTVTIASMVEKETAMDEERPSIAAVIWNRLRRNMPLQIDPTVIYGLKEFDGNLTREHLKTDTEYNTYTRRGLPPGPICSPSKASLLAALYPKDVDYLYFVSMNNGYHKFSSTMREHNKAVRLYQKSRRSRR